MSTLRHQLPRHGRAEETCELVIMDRGFDPVAPIIHDWTYEPLVYDLLAPEGGTYRYHTENNKGASHHDGAPLQSTSVQTFWYLVNRIPFRRPGIESRSESG